MKSFKEEEITTTNDRERKFGRNCYVSSLEALQKDPVAEKDFLQAYPAQGNDLPLNLKEKFFLSHQGVDFYSVDILFPHLDFLSNISV